MWSAFRLVAIVAVAGTGAEMAAAQERVIVRGDLLLYGDNTEFRNPFREGETLFGAAVRLGVDVGLNERARVSLGVFTNQRFGGDVAFDLVRPVVALALGGARSSFVFGTLPPRSDATRLLAPLQRETLIFERPYEAGFQWTFAGSRLRHEAWLNWQRVNTREHRERFDAGASGDVHVAGPVRIPFQLHVVHEGGQLYASGPVRDSLAFATGAAVKGQALGFTAAALEVYGLGSHDVPDREQGAGRTTGAGFLGRASAERGGWIGHVLFWRGRDFVKEEGDPNYLSRFRDGSPYRGIRDYAEAGLARVFAPAPQVKLHVSARLHRTEQHYEYSYRVVGVATLSARVR
jgi:hypothetical protein